MTTSTRFLYGLLLMLALTACLTEARLKLPNIFQSGMILQRDGEGAIIWGTSTCSTVYASVDGGERVSAPVKRREWVLRLKPQPASWDSSILIEDCSGARRGGQILLRNVNFGDVFLCSGQSNMEMSVWNDLDGPEAVQSSGAIGDGIRMLTGQRRLVKRTRRKSSFNVPLKRKGVWLRSEPSSFDRKRMFTWPSAMCYFAVRELYWYHKKSIPMGFIDSSFKGSAIETFSSPDAMEDENCGGLGPLPSASPVKYSNSDCLSCIWNGQLLPLTMFRFRAVLWYQGEANAAFPDTYGCRFPAMIADWRQKFAAPDLPFVFILLAGFEGRDEPFMLLRQAQLRALDMPSVGVASAIDFGHPFDIHPRRKLPVARRAFLKLLDLSYNEENLPSTPSLDLIEVQATSSVTLEVTLRVNDMSTGGELRLSPTENCDVCCQDSPFQAWDGVEWSRVSVKTVSNSEIVLQIDATRQVEKLAFNFENFPECTLVASYSLWETTLPVLPFNLSLSH